MSIRRSIDDVWPGMGSTRNAARASVIVSLKARCTEGVYLRYAGKKRLRTSKNLAAVLPGASRIAPGSYPYAHGTSARRLPSRPRSADQDAADFLLARRALRRLRGNH